MGSNRVKKNSGITLIALVITIIVMLILVAVTISMAVNGGLFEYAGKAVGDTNNAIKAEQDLGSGKISIDNKLYNSIDEYLETKGGAGGSGGTGGSGDVLPTYTNANKEDGYLIQKATYSDGVEEKPAIIPEGYKVVNDGEKIANGIVIADNNGNEFVWIPVEKAIVTEAEIAAIKAEDNTITTDVKAVEKLVRSGTFPMAVQDGENYKGLLYNFKGTDTLTEETTVYDWTNASYKEPANLTGSITWSSATIVNGTTLTGGTSYVYDSQDMFTLYGVGTYSDTLYQEAYNKMVESVAENGGFYVGRYEISSGTYILPDGSTVKYSQSKPNQTALVSTEWYNIYKYERDYAKYNTNLGVTSEMIWGTQWDQMMLFVNGKNDGATTPAKFYVTTAGSRNSGAESTKTGMNTVDQVANIFDLEASRYEWTQETYGYVARVCHGGFYNGSSSSQRSSFSTTSNYDYVSSRAALYITNE